MSKMILKMKKKNKPKPVLFCYTAGKSSEFTQHFQRKPSYSTSFHKAIWKNPCPTEETSLFCPRQLSEHMNSPPLDFQADTCFDAGKAPAVNSWRLLRICSLHVQSPGSRRVPSSSRATGASSSGKAFLQHLCLWKGHAPHVLQPFACHGCSSQKNSSKPSPPPCMQLHPSKVSAGEAFESWNLEKPRGGCSLSPAPELWSSAVIPHSNSKPCCFLNSPVLHHSTVVFFIIHNPAAF